jgi:hypothetical protein
MRPAFETTADPNAQGDCLSMSFHLVSFCLNDLPMEKRQLVFAHVIGCTNCMCKLLALECAFLLVAK